MKANPPFVLTILMLTAFVAKPSAQVGQSKSWKEYSYPANGFAITLPSDPHPHDSSQMPNGTAYTLTLVGGSGFSIHTMPAADNCSQVLNTQSAQAKTRTQSGDSQVGDFKVISFKDVEGKGFKGFEFVQQVPSGEIDYERWVCAAHRLFVFNSLWRRGEKQPEEISRIVSSFRTLK